MLPKMIIAQNISKKYDDTVIVKNVSLKINKGEVIAITGASGAGKTTLLQILGTLDVPCKDKSSQLIINNVDVLNLSEKQLAHFRNTNLGFVFQFHQLLPEFTALENVCIPGLISNTSKNEVEKKAIELLTYLGLNDKVNHFPNELSGGEQQRVAVARALINNPAVVFADEPSGNLDTKTADNLHQLFFDLRDKFDQTFVIVTHNNKLAELADRRLIMSDGEIKKSSI